MTAALYLLALIVAAAASTPRRVGDGGEYFVMARQLSTGRLPSLSIDELRETKAALAGLEGGFESSLLDYPDLVGKDGRQDFLHFFLYSLIVAPVMALVSAIGLHPNWSFTLVNALLLSAAFFVIARRASLVVAVAALVSPIIWWVDKAHTEAFLFAAVSVAAIVFRQHPALALVAYGLAGAQNAALAVTYPFFAALLWRTTKETTFTSRTGMAAAAGAVLVAWPFLYTWVRLDRLSPMAEYAQRVMPSPGGIAAFVLEPNIGVLPNVPVYGLALAGAVWLLMRTLTSKATPLTWWWPVVIQVLLLVIWAQNPNANHGGTPGMNRWVLSLLALSLPWIADGRRVFSTGVRVAFNIILAVVAVMSAAAHLPARPENYREPTRLAARLWDAGFVHVTPAEVFAERTQGREPAFAPAHEGRCRVLLIANQQAPVQCPPPTDALPSACRQTGAMCYAIAADDRWRYVVAPANGFFYRVAEPAWPVGGPLAAGIHRVMREANPGARVWRVDNPRRWRERLSGAEIGVVLTTPEASVIHILRINESSRRLIAEDDSLRLQPLIEDSNGSGTEPTTNLAVIVMRRAGL